MLRMCVFCKIISQEIPSYKLYEDDLLYAFLDISQASKGHSLLIPKKHMNNFFECDDETLTHLILVAKKLGSHIMKKTGALGFHLLSNVNEVASQSVFHFHMHLIPRYDANDNCQIRFLDNTQECDLKKLCSQLSLDE